MTENENKEVRRGIFLILALLCLVGLFFSIKLLFLHYNVHTDPSFQSPCAISDGFNCETVAESNYSVTLGLPNAVWGIFGYIFMFIIACCGFFKGGKKYFAALGGLIGFSVVVSITLALIAYCIISSFCLYCSCTYITNIVMLIVFFAEWYRLKFSIKELFLSGVDFLVSYSWLEAAFAVACVFTMLVYPHYWERSVRLGGNLLQGTTEEGVHWIGNRDGLIMEEFSDYMCPVCKKRYTTMREFLSDAATSFKMIHRQFPLDRACNPLIKQEFHDGACELAKAAICAGDQGRFWEASDFFYNDYQYDGVESKIKRMLTKLELNESELTKCMQSESTKQRLDNDVKAGLELKINATPSFVINGKVYRGWVSKEVLLKKEEL